MRLILASASPRRHALLGQIGVAPDEVRPADIDEVPRRAELPRPYARRLADEKAAATNIAEGEAVLAADTVVALGRRILEKPRDAAEAAAFLTLLSGRRHTVFTGIALRTTTRNWSRVVATKVRFKGLSAAEVAWYVAGDEWQGKAGGYAIQGQAQVFIPSIYGSYSNVVGLPLVETAGLLRAAGLMVGEGTG